MIETEIKTPTQEEIEIALDEVVSALVAYRREAPPQAARAQQRRPTYGVFKALDITALTSADSGVLKASDYAASPVEKGLKHSIRQLGKLLFKIVGDEGMQAAAERIADQDPDNWGRRMSPIDSAWNGIGSWVS